MHSHILKIAARHLLLPFILISVIILYRGHNQPGGGFVGGLVAASAFILYTVAFGVQAAKALLRINSQKLIAVGLAVALCAASASLLHGKSFMTGLWVDISMPLLGHIHLGTPMLFDLGVYIVVTGVVLTIVFALSEES